MDRRRASQVNRANSILAARGSYILRYLAVVNRVRNRCVLSRRGGAAGCRRIVPLLISIRRSREVSKLLILVGAINKSIRTNLTVTRIVSKVGGPAISVMLNKNRSVKVPLTITTGGDFVTGDTSVAIRPMEAANLALKIPRAFRCFRHVRSEVAAFITRGSGVAGSHCGRLILGANRLMVSVKAVLRKRRTIRRNLVSRIKAISSTVSTLCSLVGRGGRDGPGSTGSHSGGRRGWFQTFYPGACVL